MHGGQVDDAACRSPYEHNSIACPPDVDPLRFRFLYSLTVHVMIYCQVILNKQHRSLVVHMIIAYLEFFQISRIVCIVGLKTGMRSLKDSPASELM